MYLPNKLYVVKTSKQTNLGFHVNSKSYILGFATPQDAHRISQHVSPKSTLQVHAPENKSVTFGVVTLQKKHKPKRAKYKITEITLDDFMILPMRQNIGIIISMDIIGSVNDAFTFDSIIIDPLYVLD